MASRSLAKHAEWASVIFSSNPTIPQSIGSPPLHARYDHRRTNLWFQYLCEREESARHAAHVQDASYPSPLGLRDSQPSVYAIGQSIAFGKELGLDYRQPLGQTNETDLVADRWPDWSFRLTWGPAGTTVRAMRVATKGRRRLPVCTACPSTPLSPNTGARRGLENSAGRRGAIEDRASALGGCMRCTTTCWRSPRWTAAGSRSLSRTAVGACLTWRATSACHCSLR